MAQPADNFALGRLVAEAGHLESALAEVQAELAGTIQYELLCAVSPRVPRVYV